MSGRNQPCACGSGKKAKKCCESPRLKSEKYADHKAQLMERITENARRREEDVRSGKRPRISTLLSAAAMLGATYTYTYQKR